MSDYKPGDPFYAEFLTRDPSTNLLRNADATPVLTANRNGADDAAFVIAVTNPATGRYRATGTVPVGYARGDTVIVRVDATVAAAADTVVLEKFLIDTKRVGDLNDAPPAPTVAAITSDIDAHSVQLVAILNAASNITSNTARTVFVAPSQLLIPAAGSTTYEIDLLLFDLHGQNETADVAPDVHARNAAGTSRDDHLDATTMTPIAGATGRYRVTYTVQATDVSEGIILDFTATVAGVARTVSGATLVTPYIATTFTAADRTTLNTAAASIGTNLDVPVGTRLAAAAYVPADIATEVWQMMLTSAAFTTPGSIGYELVTSADPTYPITITGAAAATATFTVTGAIARPYWTILVSKGTAVQERTLIANTAGNTWSVDPPWDTGAVPDGTWAGVVFPGESASVGEILAAVRTELDTRQVTAGVLGLIPTNLNATVSSRFAGGPVAVGSIANGAIGSNAFTVGAFGPGIPAGYLEKLLKLFWWFFGPKDRNTQTGHLRQFDPTNPNTTFSTQAFTDDGTGNETTGLAS